MNPDITLYKDYRDYLRDCMNFEKKANKAFSYQYCAKKIKASKSYLKHILDKEKHLNFSKMSLIWSLFKFEEFEQQYLVLLFLRTIAEDPKLVAHFDQILGRLKHRRDFSGTYEGKVSEVSNETIFTSWLSMVIHTLGKMPEFEANPTWIRDRLAGPKPKLEEIQATIDLLIKSGSLRKINGRIQSEKEFVFRAPDEFDGDAMKTYKVGTQFASYALEHHREFLPYHFHTMSIGLSKEDWEKAVSLYIEFRDKLIDLSKNTKQKDHVAFVSNNIFVAADAKPIDDV